MRKGLLGVERLNMVLQQYLNPPDNQKREKEHRQGLFREGDKVMQIKNNYQTEWEIRRCIRNLLSSRHIPGTQAKISAAE